MATFIGEITDASEVVEGTLSSLGIRGYSAYEIAKKYGYKGTEREWLEYLKARLDAKVENGIVYYKFKGESVWYELLDISNMQNSIDDLYTQVGRKVEKKDGYSLVSNVEIARLAGVHNYNDGELRELMQNVANDLYVLTNKHNSEVSSIRGNFNNYRTSAKQDEIDSEMISAIEDKVNKVNGKGLSTNDYDNTAKLKVDSIPSNPKYTDTVYNDSEVRNLIINLQNRFANLADSRDEQLNQMSEIVDYIKDNRVLIEKLNSSQLNVSDIIDSLTSTATDKALSARQGIELKRLIDNLALADLYDDSNHRLVTDQEKEFWNSKPSICDWNAPSGADGFIANKPQGVGYTDKDGVVHQVPDIYVNGMAEAKRDAHEAKDVCQNLVIVGSVADTTVNTKFLVDGLTEEPETEIPDMSDFEALKQRVIALESAIQEIERRLS